MSYRPGLVVLSLQNPGKVVMRIGIIRIELDGAAVGVGGIGEPAEIIQCYAG